MRLGGRGGSAAVEKTSFPPCHHGSGANKKDKRTDSRVSRAGPIMDRARLSPACPLQPFATPQTRHLCPHGVFTAPGAGDSWGAIIREQPHTLHPTSTPFPTARAGSGPG